MEALVSSELAALGSGWCIEGALIVVASSFAQMLAGVQLELATNAAKRSSLSNSEGASASDLACRTIAQAGELLKFSWVERGGPPVAPPAEQGFGMQLITELLGNAPRVSFKSNGLGFAVEVP